MEHTGQCGAYWTASHPVEHTGQCGGGFFLRSCLLPLSPAAFSTSSFLAFRRRHSDSSTLTAPGPDLQEKQKARSGKLKARKEEAAQKRKDSLSAKKTVRTSPPLWALFPSVSLD